MANSREERIQEMIKAKDEEIKKANEKKAPKPSK